MGRERMPKNQPDHLILTVDYEIFGNASGSPLKCVVEPAERILSIAKHFAAPVTLFVEALEIMEMAVGQQHPYVARILDRYARTLRDAGRADEAEELAGRRDTILRNNKLQKLPAVST